MDSAQTNGTVAQQVASHLLAIEAIKLNTSNPFTWASGWKSPIYCDNRMSLSFPEVRTLIKHALADEIRIRYPKVEAIAGVATAGIPQGALVADVLDIPFIYVRSKPKGHGMENMIEGKVVKGQKVVVIEDLISTGGSSLKAVADLRAAGIKVLGLGSIFTYGFPLSEENFKSANCSYFTLSNYSEMLQVALRNNYINQEQVVLLKAWRVDPSVWGR